VTNSVCIINAWRKYQKIRQTTWEQTLSTSHQTESKFLSVSTWSCKKDMIEEEVTKFPRALFTENSIQTIIIIRFHCWFLKNASYIFVELLLGSFDDLFAKKTNAKDLVWERHEDYYYIHHPMCFAPCFQGICSYKQNVSASGSYSTRAFANFMTDLLQI